MKPERRDRMEAKAIKEKIINLYYEGHMRPVDIAPIIEKSPQYVSKVVKKDSRYMVEKEYRHIQSLKKKKEYNREYYKTYIRDSKEREERELYYALLAMINRDNEILSTKTEMSDIDFAKWNRSIYEYAKKSSNLVLKKGINVTFDVPKIVRNIVHASSIRSSKVYM